MKKIFYFLLLFINTTILLNAVEIQIKPVLHKNLTLKSQAMFNYLQKERDFTSNSANDLETIVRDNEILAKAYILENRLTPEQKALLEVKVDEFLAKEMIKDVHKNIQIDEKVFKSYYLDNKNEFKIEPVLSIQIFKYHIFESAFEDYIKSREITPEKMLQKLKKEKIETYTYTNTLDKMHRFIKRSLRNHKQSNYFLPPIYISDHIALIYIKNIDDSIKYNPFEKSKGYIRDKIYQITYLKDRKKIINKYKK